MVLRAAALVRRVVISAIGCRKTMIDHCQRTEILAILLFINLVKECHLLAGLHLDCHWAGSLASAGLHYNIFHLTSCSF
jgi:hypothetical protein